MGHKLYEPLTIYIISEVRIYTSHKLYKSPTVRVPHYTCHIWGVYIYSSRTPCVANCTSHILYMSYLRRVRICVTKSMSHELYESHTIYVISEVCGMTHWYCVLLAYPQCYWCAKRREVSSGGPVYVLVSSQWSLGVASSQWIYMSHEIYESRIVRVTYYTCHIWGVWQDPHWYCVLLAYPQCCWRAKRSEVRSGGPVYVLVSSQWSLGVASSQSTLGRGLLVRKEKRGNFGKPSLCFGTPLVTSGSGIHPPTFVSRVKVVCMCVWQCMCVCVFVVIGSGIHSASEHWEKNS